MDPGQLQIAQDATSGSLSVMYSYGADPGNYRIDHSPQQCGCGHCRCCTGSLFGDAP